MENNIDFEHYLKQRWQSIYTSKDSKFILRGDIEHIKLKQAGKYYVLLNQSLKKKRHLKQQKFSSVFLNFDSKQFNFSKCTDKQILFYINFGTQQLVTKEQALRQTQKFLDNQVEFNNEQLQNHPVLINASPIFKNHALLPMFLQEQLPQIIGADVILLLLNIFKLSQSLCIGYNSIGANSSVNHLHFHLFYREDMINGKTLPIQKAKKKQFLRSTLMNPKQSVNMYTTGIQIDELTQQTRGFVISPLDKNAEPSQIYSSLSYASGLIINQLLELNIPHNLVILDKGYKIYILPRVFQNQQVNVGWVELSGTLLAYSQDQFKNLDQSKCIGIIKNAQLPENTYNKIKNLITQRLKLYN